MCNKLIINIINLNIVGINIEKDLWEKRMNEYNIYKFLLLLVKVIALN
jgi:hypothetical protein